MKWKLAPRYVGPYPVIQRIGELAYKLQLPEELTGVHPVFHVSQMKPMAPDTQVTPSVPDDLDSPRVPE